MRGFNVLAPALAAGALASIASASTWMERPTASAAFQNHLGAVANVTFGDGGESIAEANITAGEGPLATITGTLTAKQRPHDVGTIRSLDADIFCVRITDPVNFSAVATGTSAPDLVLALFTPGGVAVAYNDHRSDSLTSLNPRLIANGLDALGSPVGIPGLTAGDYFLAISRSDGNAAARRYSRPIDSSGNLIFPGLAQNSAEPVADPIRRQDLGPTTPGTVLAGWELFVTTASPFNSNYTISLTGTEYSTIPAPGAAGLLGVAALAMRRRRAR